MSFKGKAALVTGGNQVIGQAIALLVLQSTAAEAKHEIHYLQ